MPGRRAKNGEGWVFLIAAMIEDVIEPLAAENFLEVPGTYAWGPAVATVAAKDSKRCQAPMSGRTRWPLRTSS